MSAELGWEMGNFHLCVSLWFPIRDSDTDPSYFEQLNYNMLCGVLWVGCWETESEPLALLCVLQQVTGVDYDVSF